MLKSVRENSIVASVPEAFSKLEFSNLVFRPMREGSQVKSETWANHQLNQEASHGLGRAGKSIHRDRAHPNRIPGSR